MKSRWWAIAGILFGAVLAIVIAFKVDWRTFSDELRSILIAWLAATVFFSGIGLIARAARWRCIAGVRRGFFGGFWEATVIGVLGNNVLPARAGELAKIVLVQKLVALPMPVALLSAVYDRMLDVAVLIVAAAALISTQERTLPSGVTISGAAVAVAIIVLAGAWFGKFGHRHIHRVEFLLRWLPKRFRSHANGFVEGAQSFTGDLFRLRSLSCVFVTTVAVSVCDYAAIYAGLMMFDWHLPPVSPVTVWVFLALATALPAAPGFVGLYQGACILALGIYGIDGSRALAFALVFQAVTLCTAGVLEAVFYASRAVRSAE